MEKHELQNILSFLREKREQFISEIIDFEELNSPSYSPIDPYFDIDLSLLKEEIVHNLSFEDQSQITTYYQKIIEELESDNFAKSHPPYFAQNNIDYYRDRADFLNVYYAENPDDTNGEGELEWIKLCFNGFLNTYNNILERAVVTINEKRTESTQKLDNTLLKKLTDSPPVNTALTREEIKKIIYDESKHLAGKNLKYEKIMSEDDFARLQRDLFEIIILRRLPANKQPYEITGITAGSLKCTLSKIHKKVYLTRIIDSNFARFLLQWFPKQFGRWEEKTIRSKLNGGHPKNYPF